MPFFHPTEDPDNEREKTASLELSIMEKLSNDSNKLTFEVLNFLHVPLLVLLIYIETSIQGRV
jgi:hypothetical protein